jgi:D-alanyl-D-alanine carboxypeptidase
LQPASNNKLLATSLAYRLNAGNAEFETAFLTNKARNELCIAGSGDPSITYDALENALTKMRARSLPIQTVAVDKSFHRAMEEYPDTWEIDDLVWYYGAIPSALILNENTATLVRYERQEACRWMDIHNSLPLDH